MKVVPSQLWTRKDLPVVNYYFITHCRIPEDTAKRLVRWQCIDFHEELNDTLFVPACSSTLQAHQPQAYSALFSAYVWKYPEQWWLEIFLLTVFIQTYHFKPHCFNFQKLHRGITEILAYLPYFNLSWHLYEFGQKYKISKSTAKNVEHKYKLWICYKIEKNTKYTRSVGTQIQLKMFASNAVKREHEGSTVYLIKCGHVAQLFASRCHASSSAKKHLTLSQKIWVVMLSLIDGKLAALKFVLNI